MATQLLIATSNPGKSIEMKDLLRNLKVELLTLKDVGIAVHPEEIGVTYTENAIHKAKFYCSISGLLTLADDTGLEVDALDGQPGLHSARFSRLLNASDEDRRKLLLEKLSAMPRPWTAQFTCTVALAQPQGKTITSSGVSRGEIIPEGRGVNGFGYDPIFLFPELHKTMAELSMHEKNQISHRARAVKELLPIIQSLTEKYE